MKVKLIATVVAGAVVMLTPVVASAAAGTTTINATIGSTISISTGGTVAMNVTPTSSGAASSASDTVDVSTNNSTGYKLSIADSDATTDLTKGSDTIAAHSGTFTSPSTLGNNSWGYRIDGAGTFGAGPTTAQSDVADLDGTWAGMPASGAAQVIKTTAGVAADDATTVWYGVKVDTSKPNGTYTDQVTYTAVTN